MLFTCKLLEVHEKTWFDCGLYKKLQLLNFEDED